MKSITYKITALLLLPILLGGLNAWLNPNTPAWDPMQLSEGEIDLNRLLNWEGDFVLLDARAPAAYELGHMPGAINLHAEEFDLQILNLLDVWSPEHSIIIYCDSRQCGASEEIAQRLREGFEMEKVFVLKGGWESWMNAAPEVRMKLGDSR